MGRILSLGVLSVHRSVAMGVISRPSFDAIQQIKVIRLRPIPAVQRNLVKALGFHDLLNKRIIRSTEAVL